jgi:hypothetical protein
MVAGARLTVGPRRRAEAAVLEAIRYTKQRGAFASR